MEILLVEIYYMYNWRARNVIHGAEIYVAG